MHFIKYLLFLYLSSFIVVACVDDEEFVSTPNACLTFSKDSLSFDTLISGERSITQNLWVYNTSNENILIPSIYLEKESDSYFRVNVDGEFMTNGELRDIELRAKDSMCVFIDVKAPYLDQDLPIEHKDRLIFNLSHQLNQSVNLSVVGQDIIKLGGITITETQTLSGRRPYFIKDSLIVSKDATLCISEGVTLLFSSEASLDVYGTLKAEGQLNSEIVFRGHRFDDMFENQAYDAIPGQWGGIHLHSESYDNVLNFVDIHSGRFGIQCDSSDISRQKVLIENSTIHNVTGNGLGLKNVQAKIGNSQISNCGGNCLSIVGGSYDFTHCTIAQFYPFSALRGAALDFANYDGEMRFPLQQLDFKNCIITGYAEDDIMGRRSERYTDDAFNYSFTSCLLNTPYYESENVINCLWEENSDVARADNFLPAFDLDKLIFNFKLSPKSLATGTADPFITQNSYSHDRNGEMRDIHNPDMGCYVHVVDSLDN